MQKTIKQINYLVFLLFFLLIKFTQNTDAAVEHGPIFGLTYYTNGYGFLNLPYASTSVGSIKSEPGQGNETKSAKGYKFLAGYYYSHLQTELSYFSSSINNQEIQSSGVDIDDDQATSDLTAWELKLGKRFSNYGDSSYSFIYAGVKRINFTSYNSIDLNATGYLVGYKGLYTFGLNSDFEFLLKLNLFAGAYRYFNYSSDINFHGVSKRTSLTSGGEIGVGFYYEPRNIAFLIKSTAEIDQIYFDSTYYGSEVDFGIRNFAVYVGFEIEYSIPSIKYNLKGN